jgi:hypothetical protein
MDPPPVSTTDQEIAAWFEAEAVNVREVPAAKGDESPLTVTVILGGGGGTIVVLPPPPHAIKLSVSIANVMSIVTAWDLHFIDITDLRALPFGATLTLTSVRRTW